MPFRPRQDGNRKNIHHIPRHKYSLRRSHNSYFYFSPLCPLFYGVVLSVGSSVAGGVTGESVGSLPVSTVSLESVISEDETSLEVSSLETSLEASCVSETLLEVVSSLEVSSLEVISLEVSSLEELSELVTVLELFELVVWSFSDAVLLVLDPVVLCEVVVFGVGRRLLLDVEPLYQSFRSIPFSVMYCSIVTSSYITALISFAA